MPVTAYYGAQTQRAASEVNRDLGLLDPRIADVIVVAAREVIEGKHNDRFVVDPFQAGAGTSHHMNTNEVIANLAIELLGYRSRTRLSPVQTAH